MFGKGFFCKELESFQQLWQFPRHLPRLGQRLAFWIQWLARSRTILHQSLKECFGTETRLEVEDLPGDTPKGSALETGGSVSMGTSCLMGVGGLTTGTHHSTVRMGPLDRHWADTHHSKLSLRLAECRAKNSAQAMFHPNDCSQAQSLGPITVHVKANSGYIRI